MSLRLAKISRNSFLIRNRIDSSPDKGDVEAWVFSSISCSRPRFLRYFFAPEIVYPSSWSKFLMRRRFSTSCRRYSRCLDGPRNGLINENSDSQYRSTWVSTPTRWLTSPIRKYTLSGICGNSGVDCFTSTCCPLLRHHKRIYLLTAHQRKTGVQASRSPICSGVRANVCSAGRRPSAAW